MALVSVKCSSGATLPFCPFSFPCLHLFQTKTRWQFGDNEIIGFMRFITNSLTHFKNKFYNYNLTKTTQETISFKAIQESNFNEKQGSIKNTKFKQIKLFTDPSNSMKRSNSKNENFQQRRSIKNTKFQQLELFTKAYEFTRKTAPKI